MAVYFARAGRRVKIGSGKNAADRVAALQTGCPYPLRIIREMPGGEAEERWLHWHFRERRKIGEWFEFCPTMLEITVPNPPEIVAPPKPQKLGRPKREGWSPVHYVLEDRLSAFIERYAKENGMYQSQVVNMVLKQELIDGRRAKGGAE